MKILDLLFPSVGVARKRAQARVGAIMRKYDELDAIEEPIRRIAAEVAQIIMEAEASGQRPYALLLTRADIGELEGAARRSDAARGETFWGHGRDFRLYGLPVDEGAERRVLVRRT